MEEKKIRGRPKKPIEQKVIRYGVTATPKQRVKWEKKAARAKMDCTAYALKCMGI